METENHKKSEVSFKWWDIWAWISIFILLTYTSYAWYTYGNQPAITSLIITNSIIVVPSKKLWVNPHLNFLKSMVNQ